MPDMRGAALVSVLVVMMILLVFGFLLASLSVADLGFSSLFRSSLSDELVAQAAVNQFLSEAEYAPDQPGFWANRFASQPVFPDGGARLPATVNVTFDNTQPHYSVDNSRVEVSSTGSAGPVPPFAVSLVLHVRSGSTTAYYEAVVQRRWNYALATSGRVGLRGRQLYSLLGQPVGTQPSRFEGHLLKLVQPLPVLGADTLDLPKSLFERVVSAQQLQSGGSQLVQVGGVGDGGNRWKGNLYLEGPGPSPAAQAVWCQGPETPPNLWTGRLVPNRVPPPRFMDALALPSPEGYVPLESLNLVPVASFKKTPNPALPGAYIYVLGNQLTLDDTKAARYLVNGTLTNVALDLEIEPPVVMTAGYGGLNLANCQLYVNGDVYLVDQTTPGGHQVPGIRGSNATLIVNGDLVVDGGQLDAGDQGLVIQCRNLFLGAVGNFKGLLLVQNSAFVTGPGIGAPAGGEPPVLELRGGLVCGKGCMQIHRRGTTESMFVDSLNFAATRLVYDARYLKPMHRYGAWTLMSLRRLQ